MSDMTHAQWSQFTWKAGLAITVIAYIGIVVIVKTEPASVLTIGGTAIGTPYQFLKGFFIPLIGGIVMMFHGCRNCSKTGESA